MKKLVKITRESGIPLLGTIAFGIVDRGTDLLQIRPTSVCNLNCLYCSTDSGAFSKIHRIDYEVELDYLLDYVKDAIEHKGMPIEANLDSVGEPLAYKDIVKLVKELAKLDVKRISMQTNGTMLSEKLLKDLEKAGLNQINLSLNTLDPSVAKRLSGMSNYDFEHVLKIAKKIADSKIDLLLAPVWIPNVNDKGIEELVKLSSELGCMIGIQKYEVYKFSRKVPKVKPINYWKFYDKLKKWEKEYGVKLKITAKDFKITKAPRFPEKFKKGEKEYVDLVAPGWIKDQMIGVARNRAISINKCKGKIGDKVKIKILETKNNIYLAEAI